MIRVVVLIALLPNHLDLECERYCHNWQGQVAKAPTMPGITACAVFARILPGPPASTHVRIIVIEGESHRNKRDTLSCLTLHHNTWQLLQHRQCGETIAEEGLSVKDAAITQMNFSLLANGRNCARFDNTAIRKY